ncbi:MAG: caspase family protein [Bacteroidetes bacterium]|nr:caspase family protein [Bacteroidota bacterium]
MKKISLLAALVCIAFASPAQFKYYEQGMDAYKNKQYEKAITNLNQYMDYSVRDKSFDVDVHYYLGLSYFKTNSFTSAIREFDHAIEKGHKNTGNIHWFMAKAYAELKVPNDAIAEYTKALDIIKEPDNKSKLFYERSQQYARAGETEKSKEDIASSIAQNSTNIDAKKALNKGNEIAMGEQKVIVTSQPADSRTVKIGDDNKTKLPTKDSKKESDPKPITANTSPNTKKDQLAKVKDKEAKPALKTDEPIQKPAVVATTSTVSSTEPTLAEQFKDEKRYALVIGNSSYKFVAPLKNAANDATDMAAELEKSNFEVIKVINGSYDQMREAYRKFQDKLINGPKDQTIGLFYYAGHGLQNEGENYLVPVEANIKYEDDIPRACFAVQRVVVANMERSNSRMNIIILDACRNNPFPSAYRSTSSGLAEVNRAKGSFVAFATAPGSIASDGEGRNGLYTQELLKAMRKPGRTIEQVFKDVRYNVMKLSGDKQFTWDQSNIIGDFYFKFQ